MLGLAACGRKAGLDRPPETALAQPAAAGQADTSPGHDALTGAPVAPPGRRKSVPLLDWIVD